MKVGIIGCGKMADQHASQIKKIDGAKVLAVCDREPLMAKDMMERFNIAGYFSDVGQMLNTINLDVVHVTTPPQSHYPVAKMCLEAGCHVYVEKPFTIDTTEAKNLISLANKKNLKITAGHNAQFTHAMVRMRELVRKGYLGGKPIHIESHYCYALTDESYANALLSDNNHWVRTLPGSLLQNIISHGISKIAEFISGDNPTVIANGFTSNFLKDLGENEILDELRVIIRDEDNMTAYFTFSSQIKPVPHKLKLYGRKNSLVVDDEHQVLINLNDKNYRSYLRYFIPPFQYAGQYLANFVHNFKKFIKNDFHLPNDAALKKLIESFYNSVANNAPLPLSYKEIILTSKIMDEIFSQIKEPFNPES